MPKKGTNKINKVVRKKSSKKKTTKKKPTQRLQEPLGLGKPITPEQAALANKLYDLKVSTYKSSTSPLEKEERGVQQDVGETTKASSSRKKSKEGNK
jgi:hypothetical protein